MRPEGALARFARIARAEFLKICTKLEMGFLVSQSTEKTHPSHVRVDHVTEVPAALQNHSAPQPRQKL
jgi:hypothetical protein